MNTLLTILNFFMSLIMAIGAYVSIWVIYKGPENAQAELKKLINKISDWQLLSRLKIQERMNAFSSFISTSIIDNKKTIAILFYGIILGCLITVLIFLAVSIKMFGWEAILTLLKTTPSEKRELLPSLYGGVNIDIIKLFWLFVLLFGFIGAIRGWAKELLVIFSVVTALVVNLLLEKFIPVVQDLDKTTLSVFWIRIIILVSLTYFGYQTVASFPRLASKAARERLQDALFGTVMGGLNGYLIVGSILYYSDFAGYPYPEVVAPATDPMFLQKIDKLMSLLPPEFLREPSIYFALIILLIFILVVYV